MAEIYFAKIVDVLPSRVTLRISPALDETPVFRTLDSAPMMGVIDLRAGNVIKISVETNPGTVTMKYEPANKNEYIE